MVDITQKPYFCYNDVIDHLMQAIQAQANIRFVDFRRVFKDQQRFLISPEKECLIDFYTVNELYSYSKYEKPLQEYESGYQMWDYIPNDSPQIFLHLQKEFSLAHGLIITQKYDDYVDTFAFATNPGNPQINNFYLNEKDIFVNFINNFYKQMKKTLTDLEVYKFSMPSDLETIQNPLVTLSRRQKECAFLLTEGASAKEIAQKLLLSPRTVEYHIDAMREKFQVKNRIQLIHSLKNHL